MTVCARCGAGGDTWGSLDLQCRYGDFAVRALCRDCTRLAVALFVRSTPMSDLPDPVQAWFDDDVDDAEHLPACACPQCDPDRLFEYHREERVA